MNDNQAAAKETTSRVAKIFIKGISDVREKISESREVIRSVTALLSSNIAASMLAAVGGMLSARFLGPEETGSFRFYTIPLTYLMFLHLGTFDGLWRQVPYYVGKEMPDKVDELASAAGAFNILVSILVSVVFICIALYSLARHDLHGIFGWLSQALLCWGVYYATYLTSTYRTLHHFVTLARIQFVQTALTFGMVFLLPFLGFYGLCARAAIPSILGVWLFHRKRPLKVRYRFDTKALRELIKIGFPFSFWGSIYTSLWSATEGTLILSLSGVSALGLYAVANVIGNAVNALPVALWQVLTPRVVTDFARDGSVRNANARVIWVTIGLTGFMIIIAFVGSFLLDIFVPHFIPKYAAGITVMKLCLLIPVVQAACLPTNTLFATGRPWFYGRGIIAGMIAFTLAVYLLLPGMGGLLAVVVGSLIGRVVRTFAAYADLIALARQEK